MKTSPLYSNKITRAVCWSLGLIIFWASLSPSFAADTPQLKLGDKISVFSDKAYRKDEGRYFEAVGNVVIISEQDTIYGELASLDQRTMMVKMEGNVRVITKDMTLYGSHLEYNIASGKASIRNARILTPDFNLVATELIRLSEEEYLAKDAEFTTCKDCPESWSVFGKVINVQVGQYVQIKHGLAKIKGVNVIYVPYIILPIMTKRKSGLLFPRISSRLGEGISFEQPIFFAIDESRDLTLSPTFWAKRGYGGDFQYRQRFNAMSWTELNARLLNDTIYEPGKSSNSTSGEEFFRYFTDLEAHLQMSPNVTGHFHYNGTRDLDIVTDHPVYTDPRVIGSDFGFRGHLDWRQDLFALGLEGNYLRNQLFDDPMEFDRSYVQTMPRVSFSTIPYSLLQSSTPVFEHIVVGLDGNFSRFRQVDPDDDVFLRNADRLSARPYLLWHFFTWGPVSLKSRYLFDQQVYTFPETTGRGAGKNAGLLRSEVSFTMDKIFGLAYEERIPVKYIPETDLAKLREQKEQGLTPIRKTEKESRLIGDLPPFESELARENIVQVKNSYRHSQEFKLIHHYIASENEYGNPRFLAQINAQDPELTQAGWFDYEDAIRSQEYLFGGNVTRTIVPPKNTIEFQWNNTLIRKSPKQFSFLEDDKYLRDNFHYNRIGYFNVSQGYLLNAQDTEDYRQRLTRLMVEMGYVADRWSVNFQEFYFHYENENIATFNVNRRFDYVNLFSSFNYNSFDTTNLSTLSFGGQLRPTDILGVAVVKDMDLEAKEDIRTIYSLDIMPHNDCWILNLNYRESLGDSRYSFNILFNFGDKNFERYRHDYFGVKRL